MITKGQINAITEFVNRNYEYLGDIKTAYGISFDELATDVLGLDEELCNLKKSGGTAEEIAELEHKITVADCKHTIAEGMALAITLQELNKGIFNT